MANTDIGKACRLASTDISILKHMQSLCQPIKAATLVFSQSNVPILADVIVVYNDLNIYYSEMKASPIPVIAAAANRIMKVLNKYLAQVTHCDLYSIAVCK